MNPQHPKHPWSRLTAAARLAPDPRETGAPYGFSTRLAALALAGEQRAVSFLERFALRAVGVACLLALGSVALNYSALVPPDTTQPAETTVLDDPLGELLDA